ncbi:hypothetical protein GC197_08185 [bacterium]|nr:hypothetical protein [bacterium]
MCQLPCLAQLEITNTWIHRYPSLITNRAMVHVGAHPHLQKVFVACQPITNESMKHLSRSQSIEVVDICNCPITSEALIYLAELPNLKLLRVRTSLDWYIAPESYEPDFREWSPEIEQAIRKIKSKSPYVEIGDIPIHPKIRSAFEGMEEPQVDCSES